MSRRLSLALALAALVLGALGAVAPSPTRADTPTQKAQFKAWGHTSAPNRVLKKGCHLYHYHYRVTPPTQNWGLETFLKDSHDHNIGTGVFVSGSDPTHGQGAFRICRVNTATGKFRLSGRLLLNDGNENSSGPITTSHFYLTSQKKKH